MFSAEGKAGFLVKLLKFLLPRIKKHRSVIVMKWAHPVFPMSGPGNWYCQREHQVYGKVKQPQTLPLHSLCS